MGFMVFLLCLDGGFVLVIYSFATNCINAELSFTQRLNLMHANIISASPLQFLILQLQHHIRLFGQLFTVGDDDDAFVIFVGGPA